ncbi:uncharacterized protein VNE69_03131 [Vairimorpha necatrix]|uniref:Uncharacterized protein n=1 Tax=Vairimorpha necatrix TaxID=6039 RepID=A0AAX4JAJ6_9MICR
MFKIRNDLKIQNDLKILDIFELQGESKNIHKFDGKFNRQKIELEFDTFILKGKKINKKISILEKEDDQLKIISKEVNYYIFDKPPKYKVLN